MLFFGLHVYVFLMQAFSSYPYSSSWEHVIREEDLELRLGVGGK